VNNAPLAAGVNLATPGVRVHSLLQGLLTSNDHLQYVEKLGFIDPTEATTAFVNATRTFTITPVGASFRVVCSGIVYTKTAAESVTITNTEGVWYIYYDANGVLTATQALWNLLTDAPVGIIYWDSTNLRQIYDAWELHGLTYPGAVHRQLHYSVGTTYSTGLAMTDFTTTGTGALDADAQFGMSDGDVYDEDIRIAIRDAAVPAAVWEQVLAVPAEVPVFYKSGALGVWRRYATDTFAMADPAKTGLARLGYNNPAGPWTVDVVNNSSHVAMWYCATNNRNEPIIALLGQRQDTTLPAAELENKYESLDLTGLPFQEIRVLFRAIYQTNGGYANTPKARLRHVQDLRQSTIRAGGQYVPVNHGSLSDLDEDQHPVPYVGGEDHTRVNLTASQNDWNPTALQTSQILHIDPDAAWNITGIVAPDGTYRIDGKILALHNVDAAFAITLVDASAASAAGYRFDFGHDVVIPPGGTVLIFYDNVNLRWKAFADMTPGAVYTGTIYVDDVYEFTAAHGIAIHDDLDLDAAVTLYVSDIEYEDAGGSTILGYEAGLAGTATNLTAFGYYAGRADTGAGNTAIGRRALAASTGGGANTAIGDYALAWADGAGWNTAVGSNCMAKFVTGSYNCGLGYHALLELTSGEYNSALGYETLQNLTTTDYNEAFGYAAMKYATGASYNSAFGTAALGSLLTGTHNVGVGHDAAKMVGGAGTGSYNLSLGAISGRYAGLGVVENSDPTGCIYIGYSTRASAATLTNETVFGYGPLVGKGTNTQLFGNASITDTYLAGVVHADDLQEFTGAAGIGLKSTMTADSGVRYVAPVLTTNSQMQLGGFEFQGYAVNNSIILENAYYDGGAWRYRANGYANYLAFRQNGANWGKFEFRIADTGVAGNAVTWQNQWLFGGFPGVEAGIAAAWCNVGLGGETATNYLIAGSPTDIYLNAGTTRGYARVANNTIFSWDANSIDIAAGVDIAAGSTACDMGTAAQRFGSTWAENPNALKDGVASFSAWGYSNNAWEGPYFIGYRYRGSYGAGAAVQNGDSLLFLSGRGYDGTSVDYVLAGIIIAASENWAVGAHGREIQFATVANATTAAATRWYIRQDGRLQSAITGAAATPCISWSGDQDTGIYRIGANDMGVAANGAQVAGFSAALFYLPVGVTAQFGTYAAITTETLQGFITINDAAGNPQKLAVVA